MIRYSISPSILEQRITAESSSWRARAQERTAGFLSQGGYAEASSRWGEVKKVFIRLQHTKCAFCERALSAEEYGSLEHDVEHFRPKGQVAKWPTDSIRAKRDITYVLETGDGNEKGYYWLAYDLGNYATACKTCNSPLKANYFPIAGQRGEPTQTVDQLDSLELPFLIYPIGDRDTDPETLITFFGIFPEPAIASGHDFWRARVTIDFFALDDPAREELYRERFRAIRELWSHIERQQRSTDPEQRDDARQAIDELTDEAAPHASCSRAFLRLAETDPVEAWKVYTEARAYFKENE